MINAKKSSENYFQYQKRLFNQPSVIKKHQGFLKAYFTCFVLFPIVSFISLILHIGLSIWIPIFYYDWSVSFSISNPNPPQITNHLFLVPNLILNLTGIIDILSLLVLIFILFVFINDKITPFKKASNPFLQILFIDFLFLVTSIILTYFLIWILNSNYNKTLDEWAADSTISLSLSINPVIINVSLFLVFSTILINFSFVSFTWFLFNNCFYSISWKLINLVKFVKLKIKKDYDSDFEEESLNFSRQEEEFSNDFKDQQITNNSDNEIDLNTNNEYVMKEVEELIINYDSENNNFANNFKPSLKTEDNFLNQENKNQKFNNLDNDAKETNYIEKIISYSNDDNLYLKALLTYNEAKNIYLIKSFKVFRHSPNDEWVEISNKIIEEKCYDINELKNYFQKLTNNFLRLEKNL